MINGSRDFDPSEVQSQNWAFHGPRTVQQKEVQSEVVATNTTGNVVLQAGEWRVQALNVGLMTPSPVLILLPAATLQGINSDMSCHCQVGGELCKVSRWLGFAPGSTTSQLYEHA